MQVTANETSIRNAIHIYLKDSSQENYHKLKNLVFGEREEDSNLFEVLAEISGTSKRHDTIYW